MFKYVQTCLNHNSNIFFIKTIIIFFKICSNLLFENIYEYEKISSNLKKNSGIQKVASNNFLENDDQIWKHL